MHDQTDKPRKIDSRGEENANDAPRARILIFSSDADDAYEVYLAIAHLGERIENVTIVSDFRELEHALRGAEFDLVVCGSRHRPATPQEIAGISEAIGAKCASPIVDIAACNGGDDTVAVLKGRASQSRVEFRSCRCAECPFARSVQFVIGTRFDMTELEHLVAGAIGCQPHRGSGSGPSLGHPIG